jgi:hypothetical protein
VNDDRSRSLASEFLRRGQSHESRAELTAALASYAESIALLTALPAGTSFDGARSVDRALALAWMNRGNALLKCHVLRDTSPGEAVQAYDQAIALLAPLVAAAPTDHALRNSLGAAHLNRASALLALAPREAGAGALASADRAVAALRALPLEDNIFYRTNLAGAWLNRASALLAIDLEVAQISARTALDLVADAASDHLPAASAALGARRTLLAIIGRELTTPRDDVAALLGEASDLIDDGLALTRTWEARHVAAFHSAAAQLFVAGAMLYASHQPHFLTEFLGENPALAREFPAVAQDALALARRTAHERCLVADSAEPLSRTFTTLAELSALARRLAVLGSAAVPLSA